VFELLDNGAQPLLKPLGIHSAIGILLHDGLDERRHEVLFGPAGGQGQAGHDEPRGQVIEVDAVQTAGAAVEIKEYDIGKLLGS
jgi:hypothetical protein